MAIKPILFNTEMVRAILDGRKTQTRRLVKPHYHDGDAGFNVVTMANTGAFCYIEYYDEDERSTERRMKPPYNRDDILWVRETWYKDVSRYMYRANYFDNEKFYANGKEVSMKWRPSIHMPKEAARIFLLVTDVRAERLQSISEVDAMKEGVEKGPSGLCPYISGFIPVWENTIKAADLSQCGWDADPWVWVYTLERCDEPEGWRK